MYETQGKSPTLYQQQKAITTWKPSHSELTTVHSQVLQNVAVRVELAFQAFFRRVKAGEEPGYPRLKGKGQYDSITYPQGGYSVGESTVTLSKIGQVKAKIHRACPGTIKTCTVRKDGDKWYVCFSCEYDAVPLPACKDWVGIDVGLKTFAALSNGEFIENPRFFRKEETALAKAQRKFDRVKNKHGSQERKAAKKVVGRVHERVKNRRHNFVHQQSRKLVNRFGVIAVEKLNVKGMVKRNYKNRCLAKSLSDASWTQFRNALTMKAESAGRLVIAVNPAYTSQDCCACGYRAKKKLSERWHHCPMCGLVLDRDTNAAVNIKNFANALGQRNALGQQCVASGKA